MLLAQQQHSIVAVPLPALKQQQKRNVAVSTAPRLADPHRQHVIMNRP